MRSVHHTLWPRVLIGALAATIVSAAIASSHREAPFITTRPKVDGTDFYLFNSYEAGRAGFVTLIANYQGLQEPQAGPNYFPPWIRMRSTRSISTTPATGWRT